MGKPDHILLIEDESAIADTVSYASQTEGFETTVCRTGEEGIKVLRVSPVALTILDIGLPDISGFDLYRKIQEIAPLPVIFLTARAEEIDRVAGLEMGADDYVVKPFSPRELVARVRAVLRRAASNNVQKPADQNIAGKDGLFDVDEDTLTISYCGCRLDLTRTEYRMLLVLLRRPRRVWSREQILERISEHPDHRLDRTVDTHIKSLRAKLHHIRPDRNPIKTHRGVGYSLEPDA